MSIKQLVSNQIATPTPMPLGKRKFTFAELQELAEQDDFGEILTAAGVPDTLIPDAVRKKSSDGKEFDASKFDDAAYKKYEEDYFNK